MTNPKASTGSTTKSDVSLTVLSGKKRGKSRSRMGKYRATVLILVHVLIIAHVLLWVRTGSTVSPVEPSEAMQTLENGEINAGFIFFVAAILATLVFGRFFCGWGCHLVALQDLCTWMMGKIGIRPKPFRSRLLAWAPLAFGFYMFIWPTMKRLALFPALQSVGIDPPIWLGAVPEFHGFSSEIIVEDFWATFPPWYVAVPFFGVTGFAAVYFLGSKGFCTYGCPYGGIFGVADTVSPGKIVVNDNCHQCGQCTAACTSNVRVAEEVKDFGMVVDPGCMKCMDCVSACPNDALSFSFATPALLRKPVDDEARKRRQKHKKNPKRYDLSWPEELALTAVFIGMFFAYRGMLNLVPMLMAAGMAGIGTYAAWKLWSLVAKPNVRMQNLVLKTKGRFSVTGVLGGIVAAATVLAAVWSGFVNFSRMTARLAHEEIDVPVAIVMRDEYVPTPRVRASTEHGRAAFARSDSPAHGGYGWPLNAEHKREYAYLQLLGGDRGRAESLLREIVDEGNPTVQLIQQLISLMIARDASQEDVLMIMQHAYDSHEGMDSLAPAIAMRLARSENHGVNDAFAFWDRQIDVSGDTQRMAYIRHQAAEFAIAVNRSDLARSYIEDSDLTADDHETQIVRSRVLAKLGERSAAIAILETLAESTTDDPHTSATVVSMLTSLGAIDQAKVIADRALSSSADSIVLLQSDIVLAVAQRDLQRARERSNQAVASVVTDPWKLLSVGESIIRNGMRARNRELAVIGLEAIRSAQALQPESPLILHDLGQALLVTGQIEEGLECLESAAASAPESEALAAALADARDRFPQ